MHDTQSGHLSRYFFMLDNNFYLIGMDLLLTMTKKPRRIGKRNRNGLVAPSRGERKRDGERGDYLQVFRRARSHKRVSLCASDVTLKWRFAHDSPWVGVFLYVFGFSAFFAFLT